MPDGAGQFTQDFSSPALLRILAYAKLLFRVRGFHPLWPTFPGSSTIVLCFLCKSFNPSIASTTLVWAIPRSLATTCGITIVFSSCGYLDVSVPHVRLLPMARYPAMIRDGLPHWEISGSMLICSYPKLIAACHVLLRL